MKMKILYVPVPVCDYARNENSLRANCDTVLLVVYFILFSVSREWMGNFHIHRSVSSSRMEMCELKIIIIPIIFQAI